MPITSIQPQPKVKPADIPLEKIASSKALTEKEKAREAARQFEAVLVRQILTAAQKPAFPSKFSLTGVSHAIYQDMMVNELADKISSSRSLGLAQELEAQLTRQSGDQKPAPEQSPSRPAVASPLPLTKAPRR